MKKVSFKQFLKENNEAELNDSDFAEVSLNTDPDNNVEPENQDDTVNPEKDQNQNTDPDKQGIIRVIPNAHLVYKRDDGKGSFEELWVYKIKNDMKSSYDIRNEILAGTDIKKAKPNQMMETKPMNFGQQAMCNF